MKKKFQRSLSKRSFAKRIGDIGLEKWTAKTPSNGGSTREQTGARNGV